MDGVLEHTDTAQVPETRGSDPVQTYTGDHMIQAKDLQEGQAIRFEFGAPSNWISLEIREVHIFEKQVTLVGKNNGYQDDYSFQPVELVELITEEG